jgi:hypothetical protein
VGRGRTESSEARGRGRRRSDRGQRRAPGPEATACFGARGGGVLREKRSRSRVKRSSGVKGEAVEAMACSRGEVVEGVLRRRRCAPGVGGVKDLKHASDKKLLSVERATRAPNIYIGGQMRDAHSLRHIAHFFRRIVHYV